MNVQVPDKLPPKKRPTIRDVAQAAGVSHQTVSRYFRSNATVNEGMRGRISAAIAALDYRPNLVARAMRDRRTRRLALLLPSGTAISSLKMLVGATAAARESGYVVELVTLAGSSQERAARALELADSGLFEGIVSLADLPLSIEQLNSVRSPVVVSPNYDEHMRGVGELADASCLAGIIEKMAALGHRTFIHVAGDYEHASARERRDVYLETIRRLGLRSYAVIDCGWSPHIARQAVLDLPEDSGVTAVIGANDLVATGAVSGALERGWRIPEDLSVTGWDNVPVAAVMRPSMSTVDVDHERLGRRIVTRLLAVLRDQPEPADDSTITKVIWRDSVGPAATRAPTGVIKHAGGG